MDAFLRPAEIKSRAKEAGLSARELCRRAWISESTLWRWEKKKFAPNMKVYERLMMVITEAERERGEQPAPAEAAE